MVAEDRRTVRALGRQATWQLPVSRVTALALRRAPNRPAELLSVVATDFALMTTRLGRSGEAAPSTPHRLGGLLPPDPASGAEGSDFRGVAADAAGLVFVLQKGPSQVVIVDAGLTRLVGIVNLVVDGREPAIGRAWAADPRARGNSLLLLGGGHLLLGVQHHLVEFGPRTNEPVGIGQEALIGDGQSLTDSGRRERDHRPLGCWRVDDLQRTDDLAADGAGRLYALSSAGRRLARLRPGAIRTFWRSRRAGWWPDMRPAPLPSGAGDSHRSSP